MPDSICSERLFGQVAVDRAVQAGNMYGFKVPVLTTLQIFVRA